MLFWISVKIRTKMFASNNIHNYYFVPCTFPGWQDVPLMPESWALSSLKMDEASKTCPGLLTT